MQMYPLGGGKSKEAMLAQTVALTDKSLDTVALISTAKVLLSRYGKDSTGRSFALPNRCRVDDDPKGIGDEAVPRSKKGVYISLEMQTLFLIKRIA